MRTIKSILTSLYIVAVALCLSSGTSSAGAILQAISATANIGDLIGTPNLIRDQSGLSAGYTSGVTDFATYIGTNPTNNNNVGVWVGDLGSTAAQLTLDLGGPTVIGSFALWSRGVAFQGVRDFSLIASADSSFTTSTALGSFTAAEAVAIGNDALPRVFSFMATTATFVRFDITSIYGTCCVSISEVAFEQSVLPPVPAPEPGTLAIMGIGLLGLSLMRRKRSA